MAERTELVVLPFPTATPHSDFTTFGDEDHPLRPSRLGKLVGCPMSVFLTMHDEEGVPHSSAETGNLIHSAAASFHKTTGSVDDRTEAGLVALDQARLQFPNGDQAKAVRVFHQYAGDTENQNAVVLWCEQQVTLRLAPHPNDPTGKPVVIRGTLDQVRVDAKGVPRVWDIKTGDRLSTGETVDEYQIQQAGYVLAARYSLDKSIQPGGIIYTPGYEKPRGRRQLPLKVTEEDCRVLMIQVVASVAAIRAGHDAFKPSAETCRFCGVKVYPTCLSMLRGFYGR